MVIAKTRIKRHKAMKQASWGMALPKFNVLDYKSSLMNVLNYFNLEVDDKKKKTQAIAYWKRMGLNVAPLSSLHENNFKQAGPVSYLAEQDLLDEHDSVKLGTIYSQLIAKAKKPKVAEEVVVAEVPTKSVLDYVKDSAHNHMGDIDGAMDDLRKTGKTIFNIKDYLAKNTVSAPVAKEIGDFYKPRLKEYKEVLSQRDEDLNEGYGNIDWRTFKKMIEFLEGVIAASNVVTVVSRNTRKPRTRKEKPAVVVAAKVKYCKEDPKLKLKGLTPDKVVGTTEVWIYHTPWKRLFKFVAQDGMMFTWRGTTLQNWDPEQSQAKVLRKPDEFFKGIDAMTKRPLAKAFGEVKSKLSKVTGRTNEQSVIVKAF